MADFEQVPDNAPATAGERDRAATMRPPVRLDVVGREREMHLLYAAIAAGCDVVLEGPPGTSKSTMLRAIAAAWTMPLVFVEGNADLTVARLIGYHSPVRVLSEGYTAENFVPGPLIEAMQSGGFLYIEELNRAPADTVSALLGAIAERQVTVPRAGTVVASPSFRVIASMNPYDNVGTTRLPSALHDRVCRLSVDYQDAASERKIVERSVPGAAMSPHLAKHLIADAVALTRATRSHQDVGQGASVRGAIDLTRICAQLMLDRAVAGPEDDKYPYLVYDAMIVALSGRIKLDPVSELSPEQVLERIWEERFINARRATQPG